MDPIPIEDPSARPGEVTERSIGPLTRSVVFGDRPRAFSALGARFSADIQQVLEKLPDVSQLRSELDRGPLGAQLKAVRDLSESRHPAAFADLEALANGAEVELDELVLLNLRGDLGPLAGGGCSDIAWSSGSGALIAHNEDDYPEIASFCRLLTLCLDDEPSVTAWWVPGFLPGNTWALTEHGLFYTVDHISIANPPAAPGRQFLARGLQRAQSPSEALDWLRRNESAGGFTFTLARLGDPTVIVAEVGAGHVSAVVVEPGDVPRWHSNHARYLPAGLDMPSAESTARGCRLEQIVADAYPSVDSLMSILRSQAPAGVFRDASNGDDLATHCSIVADLAAEEIAIAGLGQDDVAIRSAELQGV